jgi:tetratricopeptide (TPR) repeat protein
LSRVLFRISVGFVTGALVLLAVSLYMSNYYLGEQLRLMSVGDTPGARSAVELAARLDPFSPAPLTSEANIDLLEGRIQAASDALGEAIRRDPVNYNNYVLLGNLQMERLGKPQDAAESYQNALEHNPHAIAVVSRYANALLNAGESEEARAQYEWLRENGQISFEDLYALGRLQVRLGEPEEAIQTLEDTKDKASAGLESLDEPRKTDRETFIESLDLAIADALVVQGSYAEAREVLLQSGAEQAPVVLALLEEDPDGYRESVRAAPIS